MQVCLLFAPDVDGPRSISSTKAATSPPLENFCSIQGRLRQHLASIEHWYACFYPCCTGRKCLSRQLSIYACLCNEMPVRKVSACKKGIPLGILIEPLAVSSLQDSVLRCAELDSPSKALPLDCCFCLCWPLHAHHLHQLTCRQDFEGSPHIKSILLSLRP